MTKAKRVAVALDEDMDRRFTEIKKSQFFDTSYASMFREIIKLGLDAYEEKHNV